METTIPQSQDPIREEPHEANTSPFALMNGAGDVVLHDGSTVLVQVMRPADEAGLVSLFQSLSDEARWFRFFSPAKDSALAAEAHREVNLDHTFGLFALSGVEKRVVGHAFYAALDGRRAEVAFTIADDYRGRGLGTILLGQLAEVPIEVGATAGQLHVTFPTSFRGEAIEKFERRESIAAVNALRLFFNPRAVAVIGASRQRGTIGGESFIICSPMAFMGRSFPSIPPPK